MLPIDIEHRFDEASLSRVERLYMLDDAFNAQTFRALGFERTVVTQTHSGDQLTRALRLCPLAALPKPFASLVPRGAFFIEEHVSYDFGQHRGSFVTRPSVLTQQFRAEGSVALAQEGAIVVFRLAGAAHASLSLLSRRAEKQSVQTAEEQHAALAEAVRARLAEERWAARPPAA